MVSKCDDMSSGDSMTITHNVLMALIRSVGDGRLKESRRRGNKDANSGSNTSFGTLAIVLESAIK